MSRRNLILALAVVVIAAFASFAIARTIFFDSGGGVEAQTPPQNGPTPGPETQQATHALDEDNAKPRFEGTLNGFVFFDPTKSPAQEPPPCLSIAPAQKTDATSTDIVASNLNFTVTYLPANMKLTYKNGNKCGSIVVAVVRNYGVDGGGQIAIMRVANTPQIVSDAPADRLTASSVGGRPAVVESAVIKDGKTSVYMRDDKGYWIVSGTHLNPDEVLKVAEGVK